MTQAETLAAVALAGLSMILFLCVKEIVNISRSIRRPKNESAINAPAMYERDISLVEEIDFETALAMADIDRDLARLMYMEEI
jgi:hypothetical protein